MIVMQAKLKIMTESPITILKEKLYYLAVSLFEPGGSKFYSHDECMWLPEMVAGGSVQCKSSFWPQCVVIIVHHITTIPDTWQ